MTMNQQDKDALKQNWDQAKSQLQAQFPDVTEEDFNAARNDPGSFAQTVADRTGQDKAQIEQQLQQVAQQFSQGGQAQGQTQS